MGLRLRNSSGNYVELNAPSSIATDVNLTLPNTDGDSGQYLQTNGSGALSWATLPASGKILQVVNATYGTVTSSSTNTYVDTGLTATITPTSASSKVLVFVNQTGLAKSGNHTWVDLKLLRGSTDLIKFESVAAQTGTTAFNGVGASSACYLDSPSTSSATTYKTQFRSGNNSSVVYVCYSNGDASVATITLMEVAA